jgi:hypothetical protein
MFLDFIQGLHKNPCINLFCQSCNSKLLSLLYNHRHENRMANFGLIGNRWLVEVDSPQPGGGDADVSGPVCAQ